MRVHFRGMGNSVVCLSSSMTKLALTLHEIFELADESGQTTAAVADQVAEKRFKKGKK